MDENIKVIVIKSIESLKDILLVAVGALATYLAQKALINRQNKKEIEKKEEEIILQAINFSHYWTDEIIKFETNNDYGALEKNLDEGFFPKLKQISFQLRRLQDKEIWRRFQKVINLSADFSDLLQKLNLKIETTNAKNFTEARKSWQQAEKEFADYCIDYLKIKK